MLLSVGTHLGPYEILLPIGAGGMGEVYKARDTRLGRDVALKVLPADKAGDAERVRRFTQEARIASALNHPNIVIIHDIASADGVQFIIMELVHGKSLDQIIRHKPMPLAEALKYATQMADALSSAASAGVIHRDFKPGNVMITETGTVKVLDFGLAKLSEPAPTGVDEGTRTLAAETEEGTILGTVSYMSPEQAEGKTLDARSDIFSFGAVLYEMLTGRRAFQGETRISTMAAILRAEPEAITKTYAGVPREVDRVVTRCLRKDPERRFQSMKEVRIVLEELRQSSNAEGLDAAPASRSKTLKTIASAAAVVAIAVGVWVFWRPSAEVRRPLMVTPLTSEQGAEMMPSFSPDANQVAFAWNSGSGQDIYVKMVGGNGPSLRLTTNGAAFPAWSPDGRQIAFTRPRPRGSGSTGIFLVPALGGPERRVADGFGAPAWSPDGKALAVSAFDSEKRSQIFLVTVDTGEARQFTHGPTADQIPAFSPDGKSLAFSRRIGQSGRADLVVAPLTTGEVRRLATVPQQVEGIAWTADGLELVYSNRGWLYRIGANAPYGTPPEQLTSLGEGASSPAFARAKQGTSRMAFARTVQDINLWRLEVSGRDAGPTQLIASTRLDVSPAYSPNGDKICFVSDRSGNVELWVADSSGANAVQLTSGSGFLDGPRWSPDGRHVIFHMSVNGNVDVYVIRADGGAPRRMTTEPSEDSKPSWSADGHWIYFRSDRSGKREIWKMASEGGPAVQVTHLGVLDAVESFNGKLLYVMKSGTGAGTSAVLGSLISMPVAGGEEKLVLSGIISGWWALVDQGIYYLEAPTRASGKVRFFDFATHSTRDIAAPTKIRASIRPGLTASRDGRFLLWEQVDLENADLMLVENFH